MTLSSQWLGGERSLHAERFGGGAELHRLGPGLSHDDHDHPGEPGRGELTSSPCGATSRFPIGSRSPTPATRSPMSGSPFSWTRTPPSFPASPQPDTGDRRIAGLVHPALQPTHHRVIDLEVPSGLQYMGVLLSDQASAQASVQGYPWAPSWVSSNKCSRVPMTPTTSGCRLPDRVRKGWWPLARAWSTPSVSEHRLGTGLGRSDHRPPGPATGSRLGTRAGFQPCHAGGTVGVRRIELPVRAHQPARQRQRPQWKPGLVTFLVDHLPGISGGCGGHEHGIHLL